jgi:hypothetical protein
MVHMVHKDSYGGIRTWGNVWLFSIFSKNLEKISKNTPYLLCLWVDILWKIFPKMPKNGGSDQTTFKVGKWVDAVHNACLFSVLEISYRESGFFEPGP